ncbi:MAG: radical SAM protein [Candidatus Cloacimonetes bacterium]|nr:radical SAM protein [Candidatus Cloacimonadota bacterium]
MDFIEAKTIVTNGGPNDYYLKSEYVMNIYRGCDHGCIYCYARSNYYEKTDNFDKVRAKQDALRIVRDDLLKKKKKGVILTGGVSDPYNSKEKEYKLTRNALELINAFSFGICIITKSDLVKRDTDILLDIKEHSPTSVNFSITCSDDEMCRKVEPFASTTTERFEAIEHLSKNGIITGVLIDPVIPYITDSTENIQELVKKAKAHGAKYVYISTLVTMADVQRDYFYQEAEKHYPGISEKYKERFKNYYRCYSPYSKKLWKTFVESCEKQGINYDMPTANEMIRRDYDIFSTIEQLKLPFDV